MARSSVNREALVALVRRPDGDFHQWLLRTGYQIRDRAIINCNVDTGRLRSSITVAMTSEPSVRVGTDVDYARYVHDGRGWVYPVTAQTLRWVGATGVVFSRRSRPYAGNPFLRDALEATIRDL